MTVQAAAQVTASQTVTTTTETVAAVLPAVSQVEAGGAGLLVSGSVNFTPGTTAVSATLRVRVGSTIAGALVGNADTTSGLVAGSPYQIPFNVVVPPGTFSYGNQFCVTVTQPAATGNGAINDATIFADAVSVGG